MARVKREMNIFRNIAWSENAKEITFFCQKMPKSEKKDFCENIAWIPSSLAAVMAPSSWVMILIYA